MGVSGDDLSPFLDLGLLTHQAFDVFHSEDAHRAREEKSSGKAQQTGRSPPII